MKRLLLRMLVMAITFGLGLACAWFVSKPAEPVAKVEAIASKVVETSYVPVALPTPFPTPKPPTFILDYDPGKFYPDGTYYIIGKKPKEFRDLNSFEMWFAPGYPQQP